MKTKIIPIVIVVAILALGGWKYYRYNNPLPPEPISNTSLTAPIPGDVPRESNTTTSVASHPAINIDRPVNGVIKGVIEVGASGFNSFVVLCDKNDNWELISKEFGESLAYEGFATTDDVKLGLKKYLATMFEKGVAGRNAHFVISSGAMKNPKTELIAKAIEQMGYVVNRVSAEKEGKYALKALLPKEYKGDSFVIDIGSGNTKLSYYNGVSLVSFEGPGAKYYQNGITDGQAFDAISKMVKNIPIDKRRNCFIIGGVPFKLAKETRNGDERFTYLNAPDSYSFGDDVKLKSGLNIYSAIINGTGTENVIFDWDANFTIGFLLSLN